MGASDGAESLRGLEAWGSDDDDRRSSNSQASIQWMNPADAFGEDCSLGPSLPKRGGQGRRKNCHWHRARLRDPLFRRAKYTLFSALAFLQLLQQQGSITDAAFAALLRWLCDILPRKHLLPSSASQIEGALLTNTWDQYMVHVCQCLPGGHVYHDLPRDAWESAADDTCPNCQQPRFKQSRVAEKTTTEPCSWYIDLGIEAVISQFFTDPQWRAAWDRRHRGAYQPSEGSWLARWADCRVVAHLRALSLLHASSKHVLALIFLPCLALFLTLVCPTLQPGVQAVEG